MPPEWDWDAWDRAVRRAAEHLDHAPPPPHDRQLSEDLAAFGATAPGDIEALRRACRAEPGVMPLKRYYAAEALSDTPALQGARIEALAFPLSEGSRFPAAHPWVFEQLPDIDGPCIVARWRFRHPGKPGTLDVTWDGRRPVATPKPGAGGTPAEAHRLMALWTPETAEDLPARRRWAVLADVTVDMMITRFLEFEEHDRRRPSQDKLAKSYAVARSALIRWLGDQELTWPKFLAKVPTRS